MIYVASPLGFSAATRPFSATLLAALREAGLEPHDPWGDPDGSVAAALSAAGSLSGRDERREAFRAVNARVAADNLAAIRRCDAILALLDGPDVDSGVAAELGFAHALGKRAIGLRLDFRLAGDNEGSVVNLQVEHLLDAPVARTLEDAIAALREAEREGFEPSVDR